MISPGESFRNVWTADFANQLRALVMRSQRATGSGKVTVSNTREGSQIVVPRDRPPLATLQGMLVGGDPVTVTDGTDIIDPYAWGAYSIQAAYFALNAGTVTLSVSIDGTPVSWLDALSISATPTVLNISNPPPDLTNIVAAGSQLSIQLSSSSVDAAGLVFSLNCPF